MADSYISQGTRSDVQVTGPSAVQDVVIVQATAQPSGVYFEYPVPTVSYKAEGEQAFVEPVAEGVNWLAAHANVAGCVWTQDLDANGLLADFITATVTIATPAGRTGPFTLAVQVPIGYLATDPGMRNAVVEPMIDAAVASLTATAGR